MTLLQRLRRHRGTVPHARPAPSGRTGATGRVPHPRPHLDLSRPLAARVDALEEFVRRQSAL